VSPTLWLATSALLRALSGSVDTPNDTGAADEVASPHAESAALPVASTARTTACRDQVPSGSSIRIADENEPGQRLVLAGRVLDPDGRTPAAGMTVYAYHADATGRYSAKRGGADDNTHPRLCGILKTDAAGNFRIESIRPGAYAGAGSAHIHFEVWNERLPHRHFLLTFEERPLARGSDAAALARSGDRSATHRPVVRDARGVWLCVRDLRLS
jgi:protocatechuate 3,4-dioxygenase beta subunit